MRRLLLHSLFSFLLAGFSFDLSAATPAPLKLTQKRAIQLAIENNLAIKVDAFNPDIARAQLLSEAGAFDPELQANFSQLTTRSVLNDEIRSSSAWLGVAGRSAIGTDYRLGLSNNAFNEYDTFQTGAAFSFTQPLLRGFGTDVNLASLRIARIQRDSSDWAFRQQVINVVTRTSIVYHELYAAHQRLQAALRSREAALQLEEEEKARAELGIRIGLDVTSARAEAVAREENVLQAELAIEVLERSLKQLITSETSDLLALPVKIEPPFPPLLGKVDVEQGLRDALAMRPDYQQALLELKVHKINVVRSRNELLPRLDLVASLNLLGVTREELAFGFESASSPSDWSAGVIFRLPIPNRSARGRFTATKLRQAQALVELQRMEQAIIVEVANAAGEIETARKRIATTREALRLAKESLAAGMDRLRAGSATAFEVLELQRKLTDSEAAKIKAETDFQNAISEYDRRTGCTLVRNAITISNSAR